MSAFWQPPSKVCHHQRPGRLTCASADSRLAASQRAHESNALCGKKPACQKRRTDSKRPCARAANVICCCQHPAVGNLFQENTCVRSEEENSDKQAIIKATPPPPKKKKHQQNQQQQQNSRDRFRSVSRERRKVHKLLISRAISEVSTWAEEARKKHCYTHVYIRQKEPHLRLTAMPEVGQGHPTFHQQPVLQVFLYWQQTAWWWW